MKRIEAYIQPDRLDDLTYELKNMDLNGISVSQIMGVGNQMGWKEFVRGTEVEYNFLPKIKLEIIVIDDRVNEVIDKICEIVRTGEIGDGKIFVSSIDEAIRIRTGERGDDAVN